MLIERKSLVSGKVHAMDLDVTQEQMDAWSAGMYIQDAMPQLSDGEREFLMTGITQEEWDATFGEDL
tara:strand:- start:701 stop:901 length:201 start_codon:yes stop_codon:yes gene_type:complete